MNPKAPAPTPADDQPVSAIARRVGPPVAIVSLVLTAALLAWLALAPTAIAGPLEDAPFTVSGSLVLPPDDDGCLVLVEGDGTSREHCIDELARNGDGYQFTDAYFDADGRLKAVDEDEDGRRVLVIDEATGEVLETLEGIDSDPPFDEVEEPGRPMTEELVYPDGDRVLRSDDGGWDPENDPVVLDLDGPPGYRIDQAALSPDEQWVVVLTGSGEVAVAPVDGSAAPYVWGEVSGDRWLDLWRAIRWDG